MRPVSVLIVLSALVLVGCSSGKPTSSATTNPVPSSSTVPVVGQSGVEFVARWCPQVEKAYGDVLAAAAKGAAPTQAVVDTADSLFTGGPLAAIKSTIDEADATARPRKAAAEIGVAANWCKSSGY